MKTEIRAESIQSVVNPNVESDDDGSVLEINSKPAVNSGEALAMLDKLQLFFEENDAENEILRTVVSLTKKVEKMRIQSKKQKTINDFFREWFDVRQYKTY